jgi:hypothetical protein
MDTVLALASGRSRTGLGRVFFDPEEGEPMTPARQVARDVALVFDERP